MTRWRRFFALDAAQRRVFLWSLALLPLVIALLRTRGFAATQVFVGRMPARARPGLSPAALAHMVDAAASLLGASCLPRSLVLCHVLRCSGKAAEIRLGVQASRAGELYAHAWVNLGDQPVNDTVDVVERYAQLPSHARGSGGLGIPKR